jgi:hypothetical protein
MYRYILFFIILLTSGCAAIPGSGVVDALNPFKEEKGIDVTAQVGKNNSSVENKGLANIDSDTNVKTDNTIAAESVEMLTSYKDAPWLILAFAIALAAPNPFTYFSKRKDDKLQKETIDELRNEVRGLYQDIARQVGISGKSGSGERGES